MTTTLAFDWVDGPSAAVIAAVASELGLEPNEMDAPLNDYVDAEALDALFAPTHREVPRGKGRVEFTVHGCEVTVSDSGEVTAERSTDRTLAESHPDRSRTPG